MPTEQQTPETIRWRCNWQVAKFAGDWTGEQIDHGEAGPSFQVIRGEGNLLMTAGATALWTALTGGAITAFGSANARLGVGDSSTAASADQTDLQAASNKVRVGMDATYPSISTNQATWRATYGSTVANWVWNEFGLFNAASGGTMLNRKVESLGTKSSGATWQLTITTSLA